ncbi:hypothetical protein HYH03_004094 [Edaphochlamys debaryana]|uniref:RAP domain-containing protein n=1 Tax=Edaphochlamys debaryana TaxID=47281 RepID=A0A835YHN5_9CHLO|nr:hypothetical protein HYH03_004094 [Edaphochlamys debaryana]|eukprot:KAG2497824.1 hypothetical protein HYH03_004094 [Edaphochlamys debaryana]
MRAFFALLARRDRSGIASVLLESTWLGARVPESVAPPSALAPALALTGLPSSAPAAEAPCTSGAALPWAVGSLLVPEGLRGLATASAPPSPRGRDAVSTRPGRSASAPPPSSRVGGRGPNPIPLIKACRDLGELEALVEAEAGAWSREGHIKAFNTALNLAGKLPAPDTATRHRVFSTLVAAYLPLLGGLPDAAGCTIPLHACAKAGYWGGGLAAALLQRLSRDRGALLGTANGQNHSNLWWSLSEARDSAEGRQVLSSIDLPRLLEASAALLLHMPLNSEDCSNTLIACARLQWSNESLTHHLTARLVQLGAEAASQALANSLYALGELAKDAGHTPRPRDLQGLAGPVAIRLSQDAAAFKPQELSKMLLGCAKLDYAAPSLLRPLVAAAARAAPRMKPQHLANALYSLALLQPSVSAHGGAVEALAQECKRRCFSGFNPQNMANAAWALATMRYPDQGWYAAAAEAAGRSGMMQGAIPQNWSNLWYALALVRHQPASESRLLERTAEAAGVLRQGAEPQHCANLLWALANLRLYDERLVDALAWRLGELLGQDPKQLTGQHLWNSLWALAVMGPDVLSGHSGLVEGLLREVERRWAAEGGGAFVDDGLTQLWYVQLELAHAGGGELQGILGAGDGRQGSLLSSAKAAAEKAATEETRESPFELQVASALQRLAERLGPGTLVSVQRGCVVPGLGRAADVVVELAGGRRVAVEVDGPSHFFANRPRDPTAVDGPTELHNRQLGRARSIAKVLSVPYWEWDGCKTAAEQEELLSGLLEEAALADANTRAASLNGQLVLTDSEAQLKAQELMARVQAAEDGEKLAKSTAREAVERLESRLREAGEHSARLTSDLESLRAERNEAQLRADELHRQLLELRARLSDAEHVSKQLRATVAERDALQEQVNTLKNAHSQASDDVRLLRRQLDSLQSEAQRLQEDRTRLSAALEGQRLEAIMGGMAPRTSGRIGALAGGRGGAQADTMGAGAEAGGGMTPGPGLAAGEAQRAAPSSFVRGYSGLAFPSAGGPYGAPSVGASPAGLRGAGTYGLGGGAYGGARAGQLPTADPATRHRVFRTLAAAYLPMVEGLRRGADISIPLHACAKAGYWEGGLAAALLRRLSRDGEPLLGTANSQVLSNLWWSLSEARDSAEGRQVLSSVDLPRLLEDSAKCLLDMPVTRSQHCSNILIACARLQLSNERLTHHLTALLAGNGGQANCQDLANALYALGELAEDAGHTPRPGDLQGLARAVVHQLSQNAAAFKPQELSNMLLGCAKLGFADPALLRSLTAAAARVAPRMNPQDLSNSLYSLAILQPSVTAHGGAAEALAEKCKRRHFSGFNPQNVANSAWALATMEYPDQRWYAAAVEAAGQPGAMRGGTPQNWSNLWYALALVRHQPASGRLLERTGEAVGALRQGADPQACANLLWALANLRLYDERLVDALAGRLGELLGQDPEQLIRQGLCNSLWALAVMGPDVLFRHSGLVEGLLREVERRWAAEGGGAFVDDGLTQLWYVQLELAHAGGGELQRILGAGDGRQGSLLGAARAAAEKAAAEDTRESSMERQVASALERLAERLGPGTLLSVHRGCVVPRLGRAVDVVVELAGGRRVAVEVDGPSHFLANRPRDPTAVDGPTELRNRQLGRVFGAGNVLSVPYWEWVDCKTAAQEEELLIGLLGLEDVDKAGGPADKRHSGAALP